MTEPGAPDFSVGREAAIATARTDGFMDWLDTALEEYGVLTDEDLAYGLVTMPDDCPEYGQGLHGLVDLVLDYADRNYLSFMEKGNSISNNNAYMARKDRLYSVGVMSGQGTAFRVRRVEFEDVADEHTVIAFADVLTDTTTERAREFNEALGALDDVVAELVEQGLPWHAIEATVRAQRPAR